MNELPTSAPKDAPPVAAADAFDRLSFLGWRWGLAAIVAGMALSFFLFGYALVYWRNADMDFMVVYNALVLNDGKPQRFFDHTAYVVILSVQYWFRLLHGVGLLDAWTLSAIPPASNAAGFDTAMTSAVRAGRLLALLTAIGCVLIFAGLIRRVISDWRVALMATFGFAFSGGIAVHSRILRSELLAACPVIFALLILIVAGRSAGAARPLAMALAAALCVLGLENKVQAILLIGALPIIILPFGGAASRSAPFWRQSPWRWPATIGAALAAFAAVTAAWPLLATGFGRALLDAAQFRPLLLDRFGVYQAALLILIGGCMMAYAMIWRVGALETLASMLLMAAGASLALLALNFEYNASNVIAVLNPLEKMLTFADADTAGAANAPGLWGILSLLNGIGSVLARYTFVLHPSPRPTVFLTWVIVPCIVYAWTRGERLIAIQALVLLLAAIGIDTLTVRRGLKSEYFVFTDPLLIFACAILLDSMRRLAFYKWTYPVAATLFGLHIAVGQADAVKYATKRSGPGSICEWNLHYLPLLPLHWCQLRS